MRLDYTKGNEAKYLVSIHDSRNDDFYYFANYRDAKTFFDKAKKSREKGAHLNLYDIKKDIRKEYARS